MNLKKCMSAFMIACAMMLVPASAEAANTLLPKEEIPLVGEWQYFSLFSNQTNRHMISVREAGDLSLDFEASSGKNYVRLFDSNMVKIYDKELRGTEAEPETAEIDFSLLPGVYYLDYEYADQEGKYRVKADFTPAGSQETEPNDTANKAMKLDIGKPVTGFLTKNLGVGKKSSNVDTVDYYSFVVNKDQKIKITYTSDKKNGKFELLTADSVTQRRQNVSVSPYTCELKLKAGTYYICISSTKEAGKYTLLVEPEQKAPQKGDVVTDSQTGIKYTISSISKNAGTAIVSELTDKEAVSASVPEAIKVGGVTLKVTTVAQDAFANCEKLQTVSIGKNVTKIGNRAFNGCVSLTTVSGGQSVESIGVKAFYKCSALKQIGGRKNRITLSKVKLIGKQAFRDCISVKRVNIPSVNLQRISPSAFNGCNKLVGVTIASDKLTTIGKNAFYGCAKLKQITMKTTKLSITGKNAFYGVVENCVIKVPKAKVKAYKKLFIKEKMGTQLIVKKI